MTFIRSECPGALCTFVLLKSILHLNFTVIHVFFSCQRWVNCFSFAAVCCSTLLFNMISIVEQQAPNLVHTEPSARTFLNIFYCVIGFSSLLLICIKFLFRFDRCKFICPILVSMSFAPVSMPDTTFVAVLLLTAVLVGAEEFSAVSDFAAVCTSTWILCTFADSSLLDLV